MFVDVWFLEQLDISSTRILETRKKNDEKSETLVNTNMVPVMSGDVRSLRLEFGIIELEELGKTMFEVTAFGTWTPYQHTCERGTACGPGSGAI